MCIEKNEAEQARALRREPEARRGRSCGRRRDRACVRRCGRLAPDAPRSASSSSRHYRGDLDVTEIGDRKTTEDMSVLNGVVRPKHHRCAADCLRTETRAGTVRRPGVERNPEHRDIDAVGAVDERAPGEGLHARVTRRRKRVRRLVTGSALSRHAATVPAPHAGSDATGPPQLQRSSAGPARGRAPAHAPVRVPSPRHRPAEATRASVAGTSSNPRAASSRSEAARNG